jgi:hypothetical protein
MSYKGRRIPAPDTMQMQKALFSQKKLRYGLFYVKKCISLNVLSIEVRHLKKRTL